MGRRPIARYRKHVGGALTPIDLPVEIVLEEIRLHRNPAESERGEHMSSSPFWMSVL